MKEYRADLHIHTVLSPCGDLEMSPAKIIEAAKNKNLDIIGITDHNTLKHCEITQKIGVQNNIFVLCGVEITTREEAHCLAFFETAEQICEFNNYLYLKLPKIKNDPAKFGYQVVVDENEEITEEEDILLISAIDAGIDEVINKVHLLNGIFIPAHINKPKLSIISQLGFIPPDLQADALEISKHITKTEFLEKNKYLKKFSFIQSSDAHFIEDIGSVYTTFLLEKPDFNEIKQALQNKNNRKIV